MNINTNSFNPKAIAFTTLVSLSSLTACTTHTPTLSQPEHNIDQPTDYGVQTLQVFPNNTGIAVIKVDDFRIQVSFDFDAHPDSYGVPGSEFTAIDITSLTIDKITDTTGQSYQDFTDYNDHRNINLLLSAFIEKNQLVEAV